MILFCTAVRRLTPSRLYPSLWLRNDELRDQYEELVEREAAAEVAKDEAVEAAEAAQRHVQQLESIGTYQTHDKETHGGVRG